MNFNANSGRVSIPLNKVKLSLMLAGALAFVAAGVLFIMRAETFQRYGTVKVTIVGYSSIVFFGACAVAIFIKLFNTKPGLVIDDAGITDNSSAVSAGLVPWEDITDFKTIQVYRQRFITVNVSNPEEYISRQGAFKKKIAQANYRSYGSPINLTTNGLQCNFDELYRVLTERLDQYMRSEINQ